MEMILILAKSFPTESISNVKEIIALTMKPSIPVVVSVDYYKSK
jgi:hypothetical protein